MANIFFISIVFATVMQGFFASSSVEAADHSCSDVQLARNKTTEAWTRAAEVIFDAIGGNSSSNDDAWDTYFTSIVEGSYYYFEAMHPPPQDDAVHEELWKPLWPFIVRLFKAIDLATSKNAHSFGKLDKIHSILGAFPVNPIATTFGKLCGISSIALQTKLTDGFNQFYGNIFCGIIFRATHHSGIMDNSLSSNKAGAIAAAVAVSNGLYDSL